MKKDVQYIHHLNSSLDKTLRQFAIAGGQGRISQILSHNQICNFHKLQYWNLVKKLGAGEWAITKEGYDFLDHKISVPERVITFQGCVVRHEGLPVFTGKAQIAIWRRNDYAINSKKIEDEQPRLFDSLVSTSGQTT